MSRPSELDRFHLYFEAPSRGEETERTIQQLMHALSKGWSRVMPAMPYFGKRGKK